MTLPRLWTQLSTCAPPRDALVRFEHNGRCWTGYARDLGALDTRLVLWKMTRMGMMQMGMDAT